MSVAYQQTLLHNLYFQYRINYFFHWFGSPSYPYLVKWFHYVSWFLWQKPWGLIDSFTLPIYFLIPVGSSSLILNPCSFPIPWGPVLIWIASFTVSFSSNFIFLSPLFCLPYCGQSSISKTEIYLVTAVLKIVQIILPSW